jgi:release factor glutamine methyltransferase
MVGLPGSEAATTATREPTYSADFDGYRLELLDQRQTFRVSSAGMALGNFLARHVSEHEIAGRVLDLGTGSGALALLLRAMGAARVSATDISPMAVETARRNERLNFASPTIEFLRSDLFDTTEGSLAGPFDLIVFNPPGWRSPSPQLKAQLDTCAGTLGLDAMFYGETVLLRFLAEVASHLAPGGRAIVGINSLVGVPDILERSRASLVDASGRRLEMKVLERVELPLLMYTDQWATLRADLLREFETQGRLYGAEYVVRDQVLHWFYGITELTVVDAAAG